MEARLLNQNDYIDLYNFLAPYTDKSYYIRSNLDKGGIVFKNDAYHAEYFGVFENKEIRAVLSHNWIGSIQVFAPGTGHIPALAHVWLQRYLDAPRKIDCFLGPSENVAELLKALNLEPKDLRGGARVEGLFSLQLDKLIVPQLCKDDSVIVRLATTRDSDLLVQWRQEFYLESQGTAIDERTYLRAKEEMSRRIDEKGLFLLEKNGEILSFSGVGGFIPDCKIVGPVWTPVRERGKGYGRAVTAGALMHLRENGCKEAILFTLNPQAESAYRAVGFEKIGEWRVDFPLSFTTETAQRIMNTAGNV